MGECEVCQTPYQARGDRQKYCSAQCRQAAYRHRLKQGRAVPEAAVSELESLRRSRNYYRNKADHLEFERDMALLDSQMMKPFNHTANQPVVNDLTAGEKHELARLKRYIRDREKTEWRRPFAGLLGPGPRTPMSKREASELTYELYEDVATLRTKLAAASNVRAWQDLGYTSEDEWWSSILDATHHEDPITIDEETNDPEPDWLTTHDATLDELRPETAPSASPHRPRPDS